MTAAKTVENRPTKIRTHGIAKTIFIDHRASFSLHLWFHISWPSMAYVATWIAINMISPRVIAESINQSQAYRDLCALYYLRTVQTDASRSLDSQWSWNSKIRRTMSHMPIFFLSSSFLLSFFFVCLFVCLSLRVLFHPTPCMIMASYLSRVSHDTLS